MQKCKLMLFGAFAIVFLTHCQQPTGTESLVNIPSMSLSCASSNCASSSTSARAFVYITTSGCLNIAYGQIATGTGSVSCSGGICSGSISSWTNPSGSPITQIVSGSYAVCSIIDITGSYVNTVPAGDSTSSNSNVTVESNPISLTSWINGAFTSEYF